MLDVELLKRANLTDMIQAFKPGDLPLLNSGILPVRNTLGVTATWDIETATRDIDTFEGRNAPAGPNALQGMGTQSAVMVRTKKFTQIPAGILMDLRNPGSETRMKNGQSVIAAEQLALSRKIDRQNAFMVAGALQGVINITVDGLVTAINFGIPAATNIFGLGLGPAVNIPLTWDDTAADIEDDIRRIKRAVALVSGYQIRHAWITSRIAHDLMRNQDVQNMIAGTPLATQMITTGTFGPLFGLTWHIDDSTYLVGAVPTFYIPENRVLFTPEADAAWGMFLRGSEMVADDDEQGFSEVQGRYSYAKAEHDPAGLTLYAGETRLPVIRNPLAIAYATVAV